MAMYRFTCACVATFNVEEKAVGKKFRCPVCERRTRLVRERLVEVRRYRLSCRCGARFIAEEKAVGARFRCPKCGRSVHAVLEKMQALDDQGEDSRARSPRSRRKVIPLERQSSAGTREDSARVGASRRPASGGGESAATAPPPE